MVATAVALLLDGRSSVGFIKGIGDEGEGDQDWQARALDDNAINNDSSMLLMLLMLLGNHRYRYNESKGSLMSEIEVQVTQSTLRTAVERGRHRTPFRTRHKVNNKV